MKKIVTVALAAVAAAVAAPAFAQVKGQMDLNLSTARLSAPYQDSNSQAVNALFDLKDGYKVGASVTNLDAWGSKATYLNLRAVTPISQNIWFDTNVGFSDKGNITAKYRFNTTGNLKLPNHGVILGLGVDRLEMREGSGATAVKGHVVKYLTGVPLALQADATVSRNDFNGRMGHQLGVAATYGHAGYWTLSSRLDTGRVHYELERYPGAIADYTSTHANLGARYWLTKDWGVSANLDHVNNKYYDRNEVRIGTFVSF